MVASEHETRIWTWIKAQSTYQNGKMLEKIGQIEKQII